MPVLYFGVPLERTLFCVVALAQEARRQKERFHVPLSILGIITVPLFKGTFGVMDQLKFTTYGNGV